MTEQEIVEVTAEWTGKDWPTSYRAPKVIAGLLATIRARDTEIAELKRIMVADFGDEATREAVRTLLATAERKMDL